MLWHNSNFDELTANEYHKDEILPEMHVGVFKDRTRGTKHIFKSFFKSPYICKVFWHTFSHKDLMQILKSISTATGWREQTL
jgi:hypothetical protein